MSSEPSEQNDAKAPEPLSWHSTIFAIIPHPEHACVLVQPHGDAYTLPHFAMPGGLWNTGVAEVAPRFEPELGLDALPLFRAYFEENAETRQTASIFVAEPPRSLSLDNGRWIGLEELAGLPFSHPHHRLIVQAHLRERETGQIPPQRPPWARSGWLADATAWIEDQLNRLGRPLVDTPVLERSWSLSCVLKIPTGNGPVYFKASADLPLFGNEAAVTAVLASRYPDDVPAPLAVDCERNWLLLPAFGEIMGWEAPPEQRAAMLARFGRLQIDAAAHVDALLAAGCLDRRLERLAAQIDDLIAHDYLIASLDPAKVEALRARAPILKAACAELAAYGLPQTLVHGDLHGGNVALRHGAFQYFDWTDACISHPFFDMLVIFHEKDPAIKRQLRDAYLPLWHPFANDGDLESAWRLAELLGATHHAISYLYILAHIEPVAGHETHSALPYWTNKILDLSAS